MFKTRFFAIFIIAVALILTTRAILSESRSVTAIYLDPSQPIDMRVEDLLGRMTLKEKAGQLNMPIGGAPMLGTGIPAQMEGAKGFVAGTLIPEIGPGGSFLELTNAILKEGPRQQAAYLNELQKIASQTRLKIPVMQDDTGTHGSMFSGATIFPEGLAIGSSFDMDLVKAIYSTAAQEARAVGIHMLDTLVIELDGDPRMGRNEEAYTEDTYLDTRIAEAITHGTQGANIADPDRVIAVLTDFPTQNPAAGGLERGVLVSNERTLRENDIPPWAAAFKAGALGVMASYSDVEGIPTHNSVKWLTDILRGELGFEGVVESEGGGFGTLQYEHIVPTQKEAAALALKAGVDLMEGGENGYMGPLVENVEEGRVPMTLVDRAVRRVLNVKFRLGLFENPYVDVERAVRVVHSQANRDLALRAGREGIVLLKNEKNLLPLKNDLKSIAVIGPNADEARNQLGDYTTSVILQHVTTVLEGIKAAASPQTKVVYARGCEITGADKRGFQAATQAAKDSELAVVVVGESGETDGEGRDVANLDLSGVQEDLIQAVYATGTPTVVVLINGRPLSTRWTSEHVPALVEAWLPGERGGEAVADVLFGNYNPTGRLPISVPRHSGQLPINYNYMPSKVGRNYVDMPSAPLYPFGYGLGYTDFMYSNLRVEPTEIHPGGEAKVTLDVKNTGERAGVETVQLYIHERYTLVPIPVKQLRGFERVSLQPGQSKTVTMKLTPDDLQLLDAEMHWRVVPGDFEIMVGRSSEDLPLKGTLRVRD